MSEEHLIKYCAPTLANIKTGSIFSCRYENHEEMHRSVRGLNQRLAGKGLRVLPLRYRDGRALIYVYRPSRLKNDLCDARACRLLKASGYNCGNCNHCIARLMNRLRQDEDFPHEIGLFLGYPPEDVDGFMHRKDEAKCGGYWKVYGDEEAAQRTFARYKKCTDIYMKQWALGREIEKLAVAV